MAGARKVKNNKDNFVGARLADNHMGRLNEIAAALGGENLSVALRWCVANAPSPSTTPVRINSKRQMKLQEAVA